MGALITLGITLVAMVAIGWLRTKPARLNRRPNPDQVESRVVAALLSGAIDQSRYQTEMARLAARTEQPAMVDTAVMTAPSGDPRARLGKLGVALPDLAPDLLCTAFLLARQGAEADVLVRTLRLTPQQASAIVAEAQR